MKAIISKSVIRGSVTAPPSKSLTIRALICAALSDGVSEIINPLICDDTNAAATVLEKVGAKIVKGDGIWKVTGGNLHAAQNDLYCGESAATLRFMTAICSAIPGRHRLVGGPSLNQRPVGTLVDALRQLGVKVSASPSGTPPVVVEGGTLRGGRTVIPGNESSQFISALLLASPLAQQQVDIANTTPFKSGGYILLTMHYLGNFGVITKKVKDGFIIQPQKYTPTSIKIEGDWSSASYFLALGALSEAGVTIHNLNPRSFQGDRAIVDLLHSFDVKAEYTGDGVSVSYGRIGHLLADLSNCIDLLPTVAALAPLGYEPTILMGIGAARFKESNRVAALSDGLKKLGVTVFESEDGLDIVGNIIAPQKPVTIDSFNDHRIAMAFSILGAALGNIVIDGAECVAKTFPTYWDEFRKIGGEVKFDE